MIPPVRLDIAMGNFVVFSLPRRLRGVNAVAKGDRGDCNGGETGEGLFLPAGRLAGLACHVVLHTPS